MINLQSIFWDFDGVLMNSNAIRDKGFELVLKEFPEDQVQQLMDYHQANGGLSRYVKFRYFFENVRGEQISEEEVNQWAAHFSEIMLANLIDENLLIQESLNFVLAQYDKVPMHIVSGSDQNELHTICKELNIDQYFKSIHGSPTPKMDWVKSILIEKKYNAKHCVLIGDSINDYEAAVQNGLTFMAYNNPKIEHLSSMNLDFKNL